jgi:hypothetical protein
MMKELLLLLLPPSSAWSARLASICDSSSCKHTISTQKLRSPVRKRTRRKPLLPCACGGVAVAAEGAPPPDARVTIRAPAPTQPQRKGEVSREVLRGGRAGFVGRRDHDATPRTPPVCCLPRSLYRTAAPDHVQHAHHAEESDG